MIMDLMLDIETLGSRPDAAIASIGAVAFDPGRTYSYPTLEQDFPPSQRYYHVVDLEAQQTFRSFDGGAIYFWLTQPEAARIAIADPLRIHPQHALTSLSKFCESHKIDNAWANGATFDHVILQTLYDHYKIKNPIHYRSQICMRTLRRILKPFEKDLHDPLHDYPAFVAHNALDDCLKQIVWLSSVLPDIISAFSPFFSKDQPSYPID